MDHSVKRTSVQATCPCLPHCMHKLTLKLGKQLCNLLSPMLHTTHPGIGGALIHVPPFEGSERTSLNDVVGLSRRYTCSAEGVGSAYKNLLPNENWFVEQCYGYTRQAAIVSAFLNIHEKVRRKQKCGNVDRLVFTAWNAIMVFWQWRIAWESDVVFQGKAIDSEKQSCPPITRITQKLSSTFERRSCHSVEVMPSPALILSQGMSVLLFPSTYTTRRHTLPLRWVREPSSSGSILQTFPWNPPQKAIG